MKVINIRIAALFILGFFCSAFLAAQVSSENTPGSAEMKPGYVYYSLNGGTFIPRREIAINQNATGGHELLFARLKPSLLVGARAGYHDGRFGLEAGVFRTTTNIQVDNEFGIHFPNHGEYITLVRADVLYYPLSTFHKEFHPYVSVGVGGNFFSIDTDNINDQENYIKPIISIGVGGKFRIGGNASNFGFDVFVRYEQMFGKAPIQTGGFVVVSAGLVYFQGQHEKQ